jgi:N-acetylglutamate synthase-like GNAT family acetyltransferase
MKFEYKEPTKKDFPQILETINSARKPYKNLEVYKKMGAQDTTLEDLQKNEQGREYRIFIKDNEIIGFCAFKYRSRKITWLSQFYISPDYQGKGYGKKFLEYLENEISEISKYIVLEYWPDATWAKDFYEKQRYAENKSIFESKSNYTKVLAKKLKSC